MWRLDTPSLSGLQSSGLRVELEGASDPVGVKVIPCTRTDDLRDCARSGLPGPARLSLGFCLCPREWSLLTTHTHTHTHTQTPTNTHTHTHTHTPPHTHTDTHKQTQTHTHRHTQTQTHTGTHTDTQTHAYMAVYTVLQNGDTGTMALKQTSGGPAHVTRQPSPMNTLWTPAHPHQLSPPSRERVQH